jgi:hypothetical protein
MEMMRGGEHKQNVYSGNHSSGINKTSCLLYYIKFAILGKESTGRLLFVITFPSKAIAISSTDGLFLFKAKPSKSETEYIMPL